MKEIQMKDNEWIVPYKNKSIAYSLDDTLTVEVSMVLNSTSNKVRFLFRQKGKTSTRMDLDARTFYRDGFADFYKLYLLPLEEAKAKIYYDLELRTLIRKIDPGHSFLLKEESAAKEEVVPTIDKGNYFIIGIVLDLIVVGLLLVQIFKPFSEDKSMQSGDLSMIIMLGIVFVAIPTLLFFNYRKKKKALRQDNDPKSRP